MIFDKAFINGKIHSMQSEDAIFEAMLVHDGRIVLTGSTDSIRSYDAAEIIDLKGKTVIPGFIDSHMHLPECVDTSRKINLITATSHNEVIQMLKAGLANAKNGKWILGYGLDAANLAEKELPNRYILDQVSAEIPVYLMSFDGHSNMGNSKVLELAGIGADYINADGELIERNRAGVPTGIFHEGAISSKILSHCPDLYSDDEDAKNAIQDCLISLSKLGYTTQHSIFGLWPSMLSRARLYQELARESRLPMRINMCFCDAYDNEMNAVSGLGDEMVRLGAVKFFVDGAMSERTAYISKDYLDRPGSRGCLVWDPNVLGNKIKTAYELGNDVCIHIIGDAALDVVLDLLEDIVKPEYPNSFELIHCAVTRPDQIERLKKLPVIVEKQPIFIKAPSTLNGEKILGELNQYYHGIRSFMDAGIIVAGGTDGPLSDMSAINAIEAAVLRKSFDNKTVVNPQECISIYQAIESFTKSAAYAGHEESYKGTLEPEKLADFLILDRDIFSIEPESIHKVRIEKTYLGGNAVY